MKTKARATKKQAVKPKAGAAKKSKRNGKCKDQKERTKGVPKIRMSRKVTSPSDHSSAATPGASTKPKNISGKATSCAKKKTNCASLKRKFNNCIKANKSNKPNPHTSQSYLEFLHEYKLRNGMVPEKEVVQRAAIAYCLLSEHLRQKYLRQAKLKRNGLI
ncbi:uncharacterized protein LOC6584299 [Drosophila mojavensis]|uniref:HMG box domain-containing protein n=1 Tax=Drosophila mojavensis TaxID=7230 RepID=B4L3Z4_DROMO|nr:uncharacterized protein LOC6584299 [Drosophila mojavensis]EDW07272.1 uncharacterized protein Dmoj_GI14959 [Drosophila mojavensis]